MYDLSNIAVLLPVYKNDNANYLSFSVESILKQTYRNIIIFIGIDGPIGNELYRCLQKYENHSQIRIIYFPENRGLAMVLNDLIMMCHKESIDFIARIEEINEQSERNGKSVTYPLTHQECFKFFRYRDPLAHPAVMFRKSFFDKAKGYRNEYRKNQDTMLWFDGFMNGCIFANLDETVLLFRVTDDFYKNRRNGFKRAKKMLKDRFMINKALHYDWSAYLFSFLMFIMTLTPPFLKKFLYRIR